MRGHRPLRSHAGRPSTPTEERGQTTIDIAVGATLFLLTMAFVFAFVPVMFQPFATSQTNPLVADRVANRLATDVLGDPAEPYVLDETCTTDFFGGNPPGSGCSYEYDTASEHPNLALGVSNDTRVNVTLIDPSGSVDSVGDPYEDASDVIIAQRRVFYDGKPYDLHIRVW